MKRDNGKNRKSFSKTKLLFGIGLTAFTVISEGYLIYKEKQGDLSAAFPEAENEINEVLDSVVREKEANSYE